MICRGFVSGINRVLYLIKRLRFISNFPASGVDDKMFILINIPASEQIFQLIFIIFIFHNIKYCNIPLFDSTVIFH